MLVTEHFTYEELTRSAVAKRFDVSNEPNERELTNLKNLCNSVLEPIRRAYGKPIIVTSGYRSLVVNRLVGSKVVDSDHVFGCAVDIRSVTDTPSENMRIFKIAEALINSGTIKVKQLIDEYAYNWIHISYQDGRTSKYNEILHIR